MNVDRAKALITKGEGQRVEFKTSFAEANEAVESLGAFANADGGTVLIGVADDGEILGASVGKKTLEDLPHRLQANTEPRLTPRIETIGVWFARGGRGHHKERPDILVRGGPRRQLWSSQCRPSGQKFSQDFLRCLTEDGQMNEC